MLFRSVENQIKAGNRAKALDYLLRTINAFSFDTVLDAFKTPKEILPPISRHMIESAMVDIRQNESRIHQDAASLLSQ